jgi:dihydrofolate reductase
MKGIVMIAALDKQRAIGFDNQLPWHLPNDLKRFKALTTGKTIMMGRKTAQSLGRALPNRKNLVLTRSMQVPFVGMHAVSSLTHAINECESEELMVIGGGEIYAYCLPFAYKLHLTYVDTVLPHADAYFPDINAVQWQEIHSQDHALDDRHDFAFRFVDFERTAF